MEISNGDVIKLVQSFVTTRETQSSTEEDMRTVNTQSYYRGAVHADRYHLQNQFEEEKLRSEIEGVQSKRLRTSYSVRALTEEVRDLEEKCMQKREELEGSQMQLEHLNRLSQPSPHGMKPGTVSEPCDYRKYIPYTTQLYHQYVYNTGHLCIEDLCDYYGIKVYDYITRQYEPISCHERGHGLLHVNNLKWMRPRRYAARAALIQVCAVCKNFQTLLEVEAQLSHCIVNDNTLFDKNITF